MARKGWLATIVVLAMLAAIVGLWTVARGGNAPAIADEDGDAPWPEQGPPFFGTAPQTPNAVADDDANDGEDGDDGDGDDDGATHATSEAPAMWWWGEETGETEVTRIDRDGVSVRWRSDLSGRGEDRAMTLWLVVFNHPEACTTGPGFPACTDQDVFDPDGSINDAVRPDFLFVDGAVVSGDEDVVELRGKVPYTWTVGVRSSGLGELVCAIRAEDGEVCDPAFLTTPGLQRPMEAELHLVVHDHGPALRGRALRDQLTTFLGGCESLPSPFPTGPDDIQPCQSIQLAIHQAGADD